MTYNTLELKELFNQVKKDWDTPCSRPLMEMKGFTPSLYNRLTRMAINNRPIEAASLMEILRPLKKFYEMLANDHKAAIKELTENKSELIEKVTPIFELVVNEHWENAINENDLMLVNKKKEQGRFIEALNLIEFIAADPRLQIKDPAFDERGMSM